MFVIATKEAADLVKRALKLDQVASLSYDDALLCVQYTEEVLSGLSVFDPAANHFYEERRKLYNYMTAVNIADELNRKEHLTDIMAMISGLNSGEIDTVLVSVPKNHLPYKSTPLQEQSIASTVKAYAQKLYVDEGLTALPVGDIISEVVLM